jgi:predicted AAA+ superfamily ATPase
MYRILQDSLDSWRLSSRRKPLILRGARQVGKTYALQNWGKASFAKVHYFNFEKQVSLRSIFDRDFDVKRILRELAFETHSSVDIASDLVIFDEVQTCPRAISSLKYFCEDMPELALACAGSLLGVVLAPEPFPVGKVDFLNLHPMTFPEFLRAFSGGEVLDFIPKASLRAHIPQSLHERLWDFLQLYYVTGGMPEPVAVLVESCKTLEHVTPARLEEVRRVQRVIAASYENDFAKHAGKVNATQIQALYRNVPSQLQAVHDESTRRFRFGEVMSGKKGFVSWERPIHWLINAGLVHQIKIANRSDFPLEHFTKPNLFKLIPHDVGILGALLDLPPAVLMKQDFGMAKGFFAEVYVGQTIVATASPDKNEQLYSWSEGNSEIEFLIAGESVLVPVEVKSGYRTKAKSLSEYARQYQPSLAVKLSAKPFFYDEQKRLLNLPLPLAHWLRAVSADEWA